VDNSLRLFPNPASDRITISSSSKGLLSILNLNGQQVLHQTLTSPSTTFDISTLSPGIYVVKVVSSQGVEMGKFIKD
jgi:hypothetical protein